MNELPRRAFLRNAATLAATAALAPQLIPLARAAESCADPASEELRVSMNYVAKAADATQSCATCGFFSPDSAAPSCGGCEIMSGPVDAAGHCDSWSPKA
jgi:hypothetical protein